MKKEEYSQDITPEWVDVTKLNLKKDSEKYFVKDYRPFAKHLAATGQIVTYKTNGRDAVTHDTSVIPEYVCYYINTVKRAWYADQTKVKITPTKTANLVFAYIIKIETYEELS